jgi:hypothetical protein
MENVYKAFFRSGKFTNTSAAIVVTPRVRKCFIHKLHTLVIYEPSAGRRYSRMTAFFKARATKERVPLINARMNGRCLQASGSYNIFCTKIKLFFCLF